MKKGTSTALLLSPAFFLGLFCLSWVYLLNPFLQNWIMGQIPQINASQPYVDISFKNIDLSVLKLQAKIDDLSVRFKKDSPMNLAQLSSVHANSVKAQVDLFSLVVGQFTFSNITFDELTTDQEYSNLLKIKNPNSTKTDEINLQPVFEIAAQLPIKKITLQNSTLDLNLTEKQHPSLRKVQTKIKSLTFAQNRNSFSILTDDLQLQLTNQFKVSANIFMNFRGQLTEKSYDVEQLQFKHGSSQISLASSSKDLRQLLQNPKTRSTFDLNLRLDEVKSLVYIFKEQTLRLPQLSGLIKMNGKVTTDGLHKNTGAIQVSTEEVHFENLKFGNAKAVAQVKDSHFLIDSVLVEHPSGHAELSQISIQQEKPYNFKTNVKVDGFQLKKLFDSLNLKNIPADLKADATGQCSGQIENLKIECDTELTADQIDVKAEIKSTSHIVQIQKAKVIGHVEFSQSDVKFKSDLQIGNSVVAANGDIHFQNGFNMKFSSKSLNLSDIQNISELNLKGVAAGELSTSGDSEHGLIDSKISISNFGIDRFALGQVQTNLKYAKGKLSFLNNTAHLNKTTYTGNVELDFNKSEIEGHLMLNPLFAEDILFSIYDRWHLPVTAAGKGLGEIQFSGPLDFWRLKYDLRSEFQRGHVMNESFSKLDLNLESDGEKINFKNVTLHKPNGSVQLSNHILTTTQLKPSNAQSPQFDLLIKSKTLRFEELDHFSKYFSNSSGLLLVNGTITSSITNPLVQLQTQTKDLRLENYPLPTSQGEVQLTLDNFKFIGQVFGRQLQLDLNIPLSSQAHFTVKAQAHDFNPLVLLPLIDLPLSANDTLASVSGSVDLKSASSKFQNISGTMQLDNFLLQRSSQFLKLQAPSTIVFDNGLKKMNPIELSGSDQNLKISLKNGSNSELQIDGRFFLRPLQFLVPFSDNISGLAEMSCVLDLKSQNLNLSGEGLIDNASFSLKGFKYPLNDITAYFDFSKSKIIFSEINATINQTPLTGQGQVDIKGAQNVDVQINAETEKVDLEFPNQYQTSGTAQIKFYGQWLPYHLKINYLIDEGNITKEFTGSEDVQILSLRPSPFLPAQQLSQKNQSIILDVTADFTKGVVVKNQIIEGLASGLIHVTGSPENPILQGRIDIQQGSRLIFKDKPFDIQLGYITFNGEYVLNPIVFINANARVSDYDINLLIQGPAKSLDIRPSSQPNLTREDIFSLLALGYTASKNDQTLSSDAQQKQTGLEVLAALSNQSQLNKKLQEKLGLNVQLSPSIDSTRNIAVPKVVVSKKLSQKMTTSYSRPLTGDQQENEVRLQYLWTKNWSLILNYQNQNSAGETNILQNNKTETGVGGIDLEFKREFGE